VWINILIGIYVPQMLLWSLLIGGGVLVFSIVAFMLATFINNMIVTLEFSIMDDFVVRGHAPKTVVGDKLSHWVVFLDILEIKSHKYIFPFLRNYAQDQNVRQFDCFKEYSIEDGKIILWEKHFTSGYVLIPSNNTHKIELELRKHLNKKIISQQA
jgi:hypothetical protein